MKRTVAFLAAVCLSAVLSATGASAQYTPPSSPPPTQTPPPPPSDASGDTLKTNEPAKPAPPAAAPDTLSAGAKARRAHMTPGSARTYVFSLGIGSASNYKPDDFNENFSPSFGMMLTFGARQSGFTAALNLNYNFFLANGTTPNDLNIGTIFGELQYGPGKSKARPYIVVCGGYFRQWIVDLDYTEGVLGYGGGAGVTMKIGNTRELFLDGRYIEGQTRKTQDQSNTVIIPVRFGVTWEIK
jgi:hypothetical protein